MIISERERVFWIILRKQKKGATIYMLLINLITKINFSNINQQRFLMLVLDHVLDLGLS
jgi:hypothetical protein